MERRGAPLISNTDQGSQSTSEAYLGVLTEAGVRISMDGRGRWIDNRFIERPWRSLKHEAACLKELVGGRCARRVIGSWMGHCNHGRPHLALGGRLRRNISGADPRDSGRWRRDPRTGLTSPLDNQTYTGAGAAMSRCSFYPPNIVVAYSL